MRLATLTAVLAATLATAAHAQTAFTYQGKLELNGQAANGTYDLWFRLYGVNSGGLQIGSTVQLEDVNVTDGLVNATLDFGAGAFVGPARWLEVSVRPGASTGLFTLLSPRQAINPSPFAIYAAGPWATSGTNISSSNTGNVGIGTTNPVAKLTVHASSENTTFADGAVRINTPTGGFGQTITLDGDEINGWNTLNLNPDATNNILMVNGGGRVGIGSTSPATRLHIEGGSDAEPASGGFLTLGSTTGANIVFDNNEIMARSNGVASTLFLNFDGGTVDISGADVTKVKVLEVVGADLAERFPFADGERPEPGTVVMIDEANPGHLCTARGAYNRKVAGVISGANNLPAGSIMGNLPGHQDAPPLALSGRVWVRCDASLGAIAVGDLLTTSDTPGHAMSATDASRSHGAVIGKAMTRLAKGESGLVLVLVNLQ
ncbi:MAG: hypothetical protein ACOYN0_07440 [Phycisphaerales bacterium]